MRVSVSLMECVRRAELQACACAVLASWDHRHCSISLPSLPPPQICQAQRHVTPSTAPCITSLCSSARCCCLGCGAWLDSAGVNAEPCIDSCAISSNIYPNSEWPEFSHESYIECAAGSSQPTTLLTLWVGGQPRAGAAMRTRRRPRHSTTGANRTRAFTARAVQRQQQHKKQA